MFSAEVMSWLIPAAVFLGGLFVEHWQGPLATFLRKLRPSPAPAPAPGGTPAPAPSFPFDLDAIRRLIPNDPNAAWDDVARAALDALAKRLQAAPPAAKLPLVRRLLDLAEHVNEPPALQPSAGPVVTFQ